MVEFAGCRRKAGIMILVEWRIGFIVFVKFVGWYAIVRVMLLVGGMVALLLGCV